MIDSPPASPGRFERIIDVTEMPTTKASRTFLREKTTEAGLHLVEPSYKKSQRDHSLVSETRYKIRHRLDPIQSAAFGVGRGIPMGSVGTQRGPSDCT